MMKRRLIGQLVVLALALIVLTSSAFAATKDEALTTAQGLVGAGAQLVESEQDDGIYEFDFREGDTRYDVDIRANDGAVIEFETDYTKIPGAASVILTEAEAKAKAMGQIPDAQIFLALPEREDGQWFYEIFLTTNGSPATLTINAETGEIRRIETYPAAANLIPIEQVQSIVSDPITELELSYDDGLYVYEADTATHEYEIDAQTGNIRESERDD